MNSLTFNVCECILFADSFYRRVECHMSRIVTLRLPDETYRQIQALAQRENRPLSNFIETATLRYMESEQFADEFEMELIRGDVELNRSLRRGLRDAKTGRGRFV